MSSSVLLLALLAACGSEEDGGATAASAPPRTAGQSTVTSFQDEFGSSFAAIFNRNASDDPVDAMAGDAPIVAPASGSIAGPG